MAHRIQSFFLTLLVAITLATKNFSTPLDQQKIDYTIVDASTVNVTLYIPLSPGTLVFKDSIKAIVTNPPTGNLVIKNIEGPVNEWYDAQSRETRSMLEKQFVVHAECSNITTEKDISLAVLFMTSINHQTMQMNFDIVPKKTSEAIPLTVEIDKKKNNSIDNNNATIAHHTNQGEASSSPETEKKLIDRTKSLWERVSDRVISSNSLAIQLLLVFILGVLVSFTPCIYPMIPITIGVVQSGGSGSFLSLCGRTLSYTMGIATTFATLGLIAASTGPIYGKLLASPWFVAALILLLLYMALSMIGLYELKMPQFASNLGSDNGRSSIISVFLFGAASGTIASPCVSPGLTLLLSVVASIGNKLIGFLLLFGFGIGLSMPLLIAGIFSSSLSLLPRAGLWMLHVKRLFGFIMVGTCFYYLQPFVAPFFLGMLCTLYVAALGIYYAYEAVFGQLKGAWRGFNGLLACSCIAGALTIATHTGVTYKMQTEIGDQHFWTSNYAEAHTRAQTENRLIFIDCWAQYCSLCKSINATLLQEGSVQKAIKHCAEPVSLDCTNETGEPIKTVLAQFHIKGYPAFLLIDPATDAVIGRWGGELYGMPAEQFVEEFQAATMGHMKEQKATE